MPYIFLLKDVCQALYTLIVSIFINNIGLIIYCKFLLIMAVLLTVPSHPKLRLMLKKLGLKNSTLVVYG